MSTTDSQQAMCLPALYRDSGSVPRRPGFSKGLPGYRFIFGITVTIWLTPIMLRIRDPGKERMCTRAGAGVLAVDSAWLCWVPIAVRNSRRVYEEAMPEAFRPFLTG
jgi:hypothetical protein